jgi:hypothetical protein
MSADKKATTTRKSVKYTPELGSETISYLITPKLHHYYRTYSPHGLCFQTAWIVAIVTDGGGQKYSLFRAFKAEDSISVMASKQIPGLDKDPERLFLPNQDMFVGRAYNDLDDEKGQIVVEPFSKAGPTFEIILRPQHLLWKDATDRLDLEFKAVGPAMEFYVPGQLEDNLYRTELYLISGMLDGKKVSGFGNFDMSYGPPGYGFGQTKIYRVLEQAWVVWGTFYENGGHECGVYVNGKDKFEACLYIKDGQARVTRNNQFEGFTTPEGFVKGAHFKMDELEFEYTTESWVMRDPVRWTSHASGRVINKNEKRKPIESYSIMEFFPKDK